MASDFITTDYEWRIKITYDLNAHYGDLVLRGQAGAELSPGSRTLVVFYTKSA
jgi:hypothetical protein